MLAGTCLATAVIGPAWADGGRGGTADGGSGGTNFNGTNGDDGAVVGGGGGGGAGGGAGGRSGTGALGGNGGIPGSPNGQAGNAGVAGGGGGGGLNGLVTNNLQNLTGSTLRGGDGGAGGNATVVGAGGGGGGAGGYGAVSSGGPGIIQGNQEGASILGGNGGNGGGAEIVAGGGGGDGGVAVQFTGSSVTLFINSGTIRGGNGGGGAAGSGGAGIVGRAMNIGNFGTIEGGLSGDGVTRANAITSTGGNNSLTIQVGSSIVGNVVMSGGGTNTLTLSNTPAVSSGGIGTFDVSTIGAGAQYQGFNVFRKVTSNTWILTGTTTAVTPWQLNGGILNVSADATLGAAGGFSFSGGTLQYGAAFDSARNITVNSSGGTIDTNGFNTTLSGTIGGAGRLTKGGGGILTVTGNNTYQGGTAINGGTLAVSADNNLGNAAGALSFSGGTLQYNAAFDSARAITLNAGGGTVDTNGNDVVLSGGIGGAGGLAKNGIGTLTLGTVTTYSGGTTVNAGRLLLANGAGLNPMGALTVNGGVFDIGLAGDVTVAALSGAGGTISLGSGTLTTASSVDTTLASAITGSGGLVKQGTGILTLTGDGSYTGPTTVDAGGLMVNGSLAGAVTLNDGILGGSGSIGGLAVNAGILAPGNSIGTLTVNGNFVQSGGVYQVEVNAQGQADRTNVTGTAAIDGGTVQVLAQPGTYQRNTTYTILNAAGGVSGAYSGVSSNFAFLTPSLSYDANNVFLTLALSQSAFASGAQTANQYAVGTALDLANSTATGDFNTVLNALSALSTQQGPWALNQISGQPYADFGSFNVANNALFMNALGQQMALARGGSGSGQRQALALACDVAACDAASPFSVWGSVLGGVGSVQGDGNSSTFTYNVGGAAAGIDYRVSPSFLVGIGAGYTNGTQWVDSFSGKGWSNAASIAAYGSFTRWGLYVDALAGYAYSNNQLQRQISIPGLQPRTASGSTGANQFLGQVETGYKLGLYAPAQATVTPFARFQASSIDQAAFSEWGANSLSLNVAQQTTTSIRTVLGAQLDGAIGLGDMRTLNLGLRLGWLHEYANTARPVTAAFAGAPSANFTVYGATPQRDAAVIGFSASTNIAEATQIYLRYDGDIGSGTDNHTLNLGLRLRW